MVAQRNNAIIMVSICKDNNIIMNWIPEKKMPFVRKEKQVDLLKSFNDQLKHFHSNDIIELIFLGKCMKKFDKEHGAALYRKFLIRRRHHMQIMYTNGLFHFIRAIEGSHDGEFFISEVQMRKDQHHFVARYINESNLEMSYYKSFE